MLRKLLLVLMTVIVSFALTAFAGYILYASSGEQSEARLSTIVILLISPLIALLIGGLVGFLSEDHPIPTLIIGLAPWTLLLLSGPNKPASISGWLGWLLPVLVYIPVGAATAEYAWRIRHKTTAKHRSLT
jgi:hypothetical protein